MIFKKDYEQFTSRLGLQAENDELPLWKNFLTYADVNDLTLSVATYEEFLKKALKSYRKYAKAGWGIESFAEYLNDKFPPYDFESFDGGEE